MSTWANLGLQDSVSPLEQLIFFMITRPTDFSNNEKESLSSARRSSNTLADPTFS